MKRTVTLITGKTSSHVLSTDKLSFLLDTIPNTKVADNVYKINNKYHLKRLSAILDDMHYCNGPDLRSVIFFNGEYSVEEMDEVDFRLYLNKLSKLSYLKMSETVYHLRFASLLP